MTGRSGLTLVETLLVLVLLSVLSHAAWFVIRPPTAQRVARELAQVVRSARWAAVAAARPTMLLAAGGDQQVIVRGHTEWRCDADAMDEHAWWAAQRRVVVAWPSRGVAFAPDGFPRSCLGDGVGSATITVDDGRSRAAVVVSSLGRVRWEARP